MTTMAGNGTGTVARRRRPGVVDDPRRLARALGWFSLGLGAAQLLAPRRMARLVGVDDDEMNARTMRACGAREAAAGAGLLAGGRRPDPWVWARVAGDAMDLALLGRGFGSPYAHRGRLAAATAAVAALTALDILTAQELGDMERDDEGTRDGEGARRGGQHVTRAVTVARPADELYAFWRDFTNLPRFMHHLESVHLTGERTSHWVVKAPAGRTVQWDAEIVDEIPGELIVWRSLEGADVDNAGSVRFRPAPGDEGTEVSVELTYDPPGGPLGKLVAKRFGEEPAQQLAGDMRRFKQVMELGEVTRSDASIHDGMHPARPPEEPVPLPERVERLEEARS